jgi:hypothetical protein
MGDSSRLSLNETRYYDPELADSSVWGDGLNFHSLSNLDDSDATPPSTPRSSTEILEAKELSVSEYEKKLAFGLASLQKFREEKRSLEKLRACCSSSPAVCVRKFNLPLAVSRKRERRSIAWS